MAFNRFTSLALAFVLVSVLLLSACVSPHVVDVVQPDDREMSCQEITDAIGEAMEFEVEGRNARKASSTPNILALLFFSPAYMANFANSKNAVNAAKERQMHLQELFDEKNC